MTLPQKGFSQTWLGSHLRRMQLTAGLRPWQELFGGRRSSVIGGIQVDATWRATLWKVIPNSQSWAAGGAFKGFGVRSPDSHSGSSLPREPGEPLRPPPPSCPLRRRPAGPSHGVNVAAFAECPAQSRYQRLVGSKEHPPSVGMELPGGPAGSRPAPSQVTLAAPKGRGWAVVRVAGRRFLRIQREPEGRQRIRGETDMLPDGLERVGGGGRPAGPGAWALRFSPCQGCRGSRDPRGGLGAAPARLPRGCTVCSGLSPGLREPSARTHVHGCVHCVSSWREGSG